MDENKNESVEANSEEYKKLKLTKLFFMSLLIISTIIFIPNLILSLRYATNFTWRGVLFIYADILGAVIAKLIFLFLFVWSYRIYSMFKKRYSQSTEISWLIIGIFLALLATKGEGFFEKANAVIYEIVNF